VSRGQRNRSPRPYSRLTLLPGEQRQQIAQEVWYLYSTPQALLSVAHRLCGLVVRVLGYRSGGTGSIPGGTRFSVKKKKTVVGPERGPLSLVSTTEELLDRKVAAPV
jgi:hypothetical protein